MHFFASFPPLEDLGAWVERAKRICTISLAHLKLPLKYTRAHTSYTSWKELSVTCDCWKAEFKAVLEVFPPSLPIKTPSLSCLPFFIAGISTRRKCRTFLLRLEEGAKPSFLLPLPPPDDRRRRRRRRRRLLNSPTYPRRRDRPSLTRAGRTERGQLEMRRYLVNSPSTSTNYSLSLSLSARTSLTVALGRGMRVHSPPPNALIESSPKPKKSNLRRE